MDLILGYLAGLLTLINPCVLPVLPIVLATALQSSRMGPVVLSAGMSVSFVTVGMGVAVFGRALGLRNETVAQAGALVMVAFGVIMLVPRLSAGFATATAGVSARADAGVEHVDRTSLRGQFVGGLLLGVVWVPCVGPTLGGAIGLANAGNSLAWAAAIMLAFALGISTVIVALAYGAGSVIRARHGAMRALAQRARPAMAVIFILVGLGLYFGVQKGIERWLLDHLPYWLQDLSVRY